MFQIFRKEFQNFRLTARYPVKISWIFPEERKRKEIRQRFAERSDNDRKNSAFRDCERADTKLQHGMASRFYFANDVYAIANRPLENCTRGKIKLGNIQMYSQALSGRKKHGCKDVSYAILFGNSTVKNIWRKNVLFSTALHTFHLSQWKVKVKVSSKIISFQSSLQTLSPLSRFSFLLPFLLFSWQCISFYPRCILKFNYERPYLSHCYECIVSWIIW